MAIDLGSRTLVPQFAAAVDVTVARYARLGPAGSSGEYISGANGDNATRDTLAFQTAATEAGLTGRDLYIPPSALPFLLNDAVTIPDGVTVIGEGWYSRVQQTVAEKNIFELGHRSGIRGVHVVGFNGHALVSASQNCGVYGYRKHGVKIEKCWIEQCEGSGIQLDGCTDALIDGNIIFGYTWDGDVSSASASDILIYATGGSSGKRTIITNNFCLSNSSQGIYVNPNGNDTDTLIANNIVVTLDPATTTESGTWAEITAPARRHGIVLNYSGVTGTQSRAVVANNLCRNTRWTGIYAQGTDAASGPLLITHNLCSNNGKETGGLSPDLSGGIWVSAETPALVLGNIILDYQRTEDNTAGISVSASSLPTRRTLIAQNLIRNSATRGLYIQGKTSYLDIKDNTFEENTNEDIFWEAPAGDAALGGHVIEGNRIKRTKTNTRPAIGLVHQDGLVPVYIERNHFEGWDRANTGSGQNAAIRLQKRDLTFVRHNKITKFYYGVTANTYIASGTRQFEGAVDFNDFKDCNIALTADGNATSACVVFEGNRFDSNVTTKIGTNVPLLNGSNVGYEGRRQGTKWTLFQATAAPTTGTWERGDRVEFFNATVAPFERICTTAGNPGTWTDA